MLPIEALTIDDLQLQPALTLGSTCSLSDALEQSSMRDYSIVVGVASVERSDIKECNQQPVTGPGRSLLGYLDVEAATKSVEQNQVRLEEPLDRVINRFERRKRYTLITPDTSLSVLQKFLANENFAIVTDASRKFVLGIATREDLDRYLKKSYGKDIER